MLLAEHVHELLAGLFVVADNDMHRRGDVALLHLLAELIAFVVLVTLGDQRRQEGVLGAEVADDRGQRHVGLRGDAAHGQRVEVFGGDDLARRLEDFVARCRPTSSWDTLYPLSVRSSRISA